MSEINVELDGTTLQLSMFDEGPGAEPDVWQAVFIDDGDGYLIAYFEAEKDCDRLDLINLAIENLRDAE